MTIKVAAQSLKINYSTAKHIVKLYKRTGKIQSQISGKRKASSDLIDLDVKTQLSRPLYGVG